MGALPGGSVLSAPAADTASGAFDVEPFRTAGRSVVLREVEVPVLVLGSTQSRAVVDADRASRLGVSIVRRRSGGGAVLLLPGAQVWADLWVPRGDPLWSPEPVASAVVVGEWWARALSARSAHSSPSAGSAPDAPPGARQFAVHRAASLAAPRGDVVCFAGVGPGEVTWEGRKVVGLAQWRSREGALVHGCVYRRWDPEPLVDLLALVEEGRRPLVTSLRAAAIGIEELGAGPSWGAAQLIGALPEPSTWELVHPH